MKLGFALEKAKKTFHASEVLPPFHNLDAGAVSQVYALRLQTV